MADLTVRDLIVKSRDNQEAIATKLIALDRCKQQQARYLRATYQISAYDDVLRLIKKFDQGKLTINARKNEIEKSKHAERLLQLPTKIELGERLLCVLKADLEHDTEETRSLKGSIRRYKDQLRESALKLKDLGYGSNNKKEWFTNAMRIAGDEE